MKTNSNHQMIRQLVLGGLMAALVCVISAPRIMIPIDIGGTTSFHLGNIMCALSGILLGPWGGAFAAGLGSAIYDMTNPAYISEAWITFLTKGAYGLVAGLVAYAGKKEGLSYRQNVVATVAAAVTYAALYLFKSFVYNGLLLGGLQPSAAALTLVAKLPATTFNAVVAIVGAPLLAAAIQKGLQKSGLRLSR